MTMLKIRLTESILNVPKPQQITHVQVTNSVNYIPPFSMQKLTF